MDPDKPTIYQNFPMPSKTEVDEAWVQITDRVDSSAVMLGVGPNDHRLWTQTFHYLGQCEDFTLLLDARSKGLAAQTDGYHDLGSAYLVGVVEALEILLTVAMNREAKAVMEAVGPAEDD